MLQGRPQSLRARRFLKIRDGFDIEVNEILIKDRIGKVGTSVERAAIVNRMQRIQAHESPAGLAGYPVDNIAQVAEIAASPVALGPHAVQADGDTGRAQ